MVMKIDHTEFIARHHKTAQSSNVGGAGRKSVQGLLRALSVLIFIGGFFLFVASVTHIGEPSKLIVGVIFILLSIGGFVVYRAGKVQSDHESELKLVSAVLEGSRAARMITDGADTLIYTNQKFEHLCRGVGPPGYQTLVRLFQNNEEALAHFNLLADKAMRGLTESIELFSKFEDNERWLTVTAQPVRAFAGYVHWRIDDVTEKYKVDRAIREEREKLIDFTDNAPVGFFSVNEQGRFVFANATFARWVGEDLRTLLDQGYLHAYLADPPEGGAPYDLVEESLARQVVEIYMKGTGGKTFLASINQAVVTDDHGQVRTRAVVYDLTSEREMRTALKESEDRFKKFFEEAPLGIILVDDQGVIADCNSVFSHMLGQSIKGIEGSEFEALLVNEEDRAEVVSALALIEKGEYMKASLDVSLKGKSSNVETQMHARRFKESGNTVLHFIDITEKKQLEEQFVQAQKMQAIGQLAGGVAHDFNNLLTAIIGFCDLLLLRHKPGDPSFGDIQQIQQNSNRAANLVRQLLAFSRQQTLRPKVHDVTDILTELSHLMRRLIGASVDLNLVHGQDLGLVKVDEGQMEQVLINLAVNARDAMGGRGVLLIETENYTNKKSRELISEELPKGEWIKIKVTDTGCGIPTENLARIFEPFFTTKPVGEGTGLGLATVYGIVRQTDGYLDVESVVDEGTSFVIYLPCVSEAEAEEEVVEDVTEVDDSKDLTGTEVILLVEDEDAVRTFSERALVNKGYQVLTADCGESALALLETEDLEKIDLLITDVVMPGIDGAMLAEKLRARRADLKIVFVSGYTEDKLKDYIGSNTWFLPKPFTLKQLAAKVKDVLCE